MSIFSVTDPADSLSLLTIAELRAAAGVKDGSRDAELTRLGDGLSTAIARFCNLVDDGINPPTLLSETCTEMFRWQDGEAIRLARRPVTEIVGVTLDGNAVDAADYEIAGTAWLRHLTNDAISDWPAGKITVVYKAGYEVVPPDVKLAASKLATALSAETARDPNLKREEVTGVMLREFWVGPADDPLLSQEIADGLLPYVERFI